MIRFILFVIIICILFFVFRNQTLDLIGLVIQLLTKIVQFCLSIIPDNGKFYHGNNNIFGFDNYN